jgi:hypothetical protein
LPRRNNLSSCVDRCGAGLGHRASARRLGGQFGHEVMNTRSRRLVLIGSQAGQNAPALACQPNGSVNVGVLSGEPRGVIASEVAIIATACSSDA